MSLVGNISAAIQQIGAAIKSTQRTIPSVTYTANHTLTNADLGHVVWMTSATGLTLTVDASVLDANGAFLVRQGGAGQVTIAAASGTTFHTDAATTKLAAQYALATGIVESASAVDLNGGLAAS